MSKNRLNNETCNLLRQAALERVQQLERLSDNFNLISKQLELLNVIDDIILLANSSPDGQVEIIFSKPSMDETSSINKIIENSVYTISSFNISNPESRKVLMRTVIVIDPLWSKNFMVFRGQYGLPNSTLQEYEND